MNKKIGIAIAVVAALIIVGFFAWKYMGTMNAPQASVEESAPNAPQNGQQATTTQDAQVVDLGEGLLIRDVTIGTGAEAISGKRVCAKYVGRLTDGTVFDASELHPQMKDTGFCFTLGNDQVIQGWHRGLVGMKVGGQRLLQVPPALGYGANANGPIPANATLIFAIELAKVE